jgi:xanthine dehydrogenase accessory factor
LVCGGVMDIAIQIFATPESAGAMKTAIEEHSTNRAVLIRVDVLDESLKNTNFEIEIPPTPTLLIAGAGHVGRALSRLAGQIDFKVTVIDDRPDCLSAAMFPGATCIVGDIERELCKFEITRWTYIAIVTRGHRHDAQALAAVINSAAAYIGLIGSKRKIHTILTELKDQGVSREKLTRVHAPIGLEIAAVTPAEIAVSIAAELIAVRRGRENLAAHPMKVPADKLDHWLRDKAASG